MERDDPDLLVLQLLSVDQTGHARGSYNSEYLAKIEESDRIIQEFLGWCETNGYLDEATVLITADHGQGIGIGGHGHITPSERYVPCIVWGEGVELSGTADDEPRSVMDVAATIAYFLGVEPPAQSVGQALGVSEGDSDSRPVAVIIPAHNEAENLPSTLARIPRREHRGRSSRNRWADRLQSVLPSRAGARRNHPRLQLRPSADARPAEEGHDYAGGASFLFPSR